MKNRQWLLKKRPVGVVSADDFEKRTSDDVPTTLPPGQILVRNRMFLCAPTIRNWMSGQKNSLFRTIDIGAPIAAPSAGEVVASADERFPVGSRVTAIGSWQDYEVLDAATQILSRVPDDVSLVEAMGPYGLNPQTAFFGLTRIGRPKKGDTVVVSGAAGSTGSTAAQIARILGCRIIGIAGGAEKCRWLIDVCKLDAVIDYKNENLRDRLGELCPNGINVFYDNVGGETLQAAVDHMARHGVIVVCGQIASYNDDDLPEGPRNMMRVVYGSVRIEGFLLGDFITESRDAITQLREWADAGQLVHRVDFRKGFDQLPSILSDLFTGGNSGTLLVEIESF